MAIMNAANREAARKAFVEDLGNVREPIGITRPELIAAVNAADQWASDNASAFNLALPVAARTALTAPQKARLLSAVILQRFTSGA